MKIVTNTYNAGFIHPDWDNVPRNDPEFVKKAEEGYFEDDDITNVRIVEIPDNVTDWKIIYDYDYDHEQVWYVLDGKMYKGEPTWTEADFKRWEEEERMFEGWEDDE